MSQNNTTIYDSVNFLKGSIIQRSDLCTTPHKTHLSPRTTHTHPRYIEEYGIIKEMKRQSPITDLFDVGDTHTMSSHFVLSSILFILILFIPLPAHASPTSFFTNFFTETYCGTISLLGFSCEEREEIVVAPPVTPPETVEDTIVIPPTTIEIPEEITPVETKQTPPTPIEEEK